MLFAAVGKVRTRPRLNGPQLSTDRLRVQPPDRASSTGLTLNRKQLSYRVGVKRLGPGRGHVEDICGQASRATRHGGLGGEEREQPRPRDLPGEHDTSEGIRTMGLESMFRDVQADHGNLGHGRLLEWCHHARHSGTSMPSGGVHPISRDRLQANAIGAG